MIKRALFVASVLGFLIPVLNADPIVYPANGQSADQQRKDESDCYHWAKGKTGYDPMSASDNQVQQAQTKSGGAAKGALAGAATGAIIGDSSKYARRAGAVGAVAGGASQASKNKQAQQQTQAQADQVAARRAEYNKGYAACMEGRGYSVK